MTLEQRKRILFYALIFVVGGIFGFFYEELFYRIDLGEWVKRGSTFGPWIPIYGFGSMLIVKTTEDHIEKPGKVFWIGLVVCGAMELITGWVLLHGLGLRLWDYNHEIWNWGNIGGFICIRSVAFFGICALLIQYIGRPVLNYIIDHCHTPSRQLLALAPCVLFALDIALYMLLH